MIAFKREQHQLSRCHLHHMPLVFSDLDDIVHYKRLADAHQHTGEVVLGDVLERKAECDADHAGRAEECAHERRDAKDVEDEDEADEDQSGPRDRKSTRLNSSHVAISYAVFCLKKKNDNKVSAEEDHSV